MSERSPDITALVERLRAKVTTAQPASDTGQLAAEAADALEALVKDQDEALLALGWKRGTSISCATKGREIIGRIGGLKASVRRAVKERDEAEEEICPLALGNPHEPCALEKVAIDRALAAEARAERAEKALEPFAGAWVSCSDEGDKDEWSAWESGLAMSVSYGDFRIAAQALSESQEKGG